MSSFRSNAGPGRRYISEVLEINSYDPDADLFDYCAIYQRQETPA